MAMPITNASSSVKNDEKKSVPRYWKIEIKRPELLHFLVESLELPVLTRALALVPCPRVVLLSFGEKRDTEAAKKDFHDTNIALKRLDGRCCALTLNQVFFNSQVVFFKAILSAEFPAKLREKCHHVTVCSAPGADHGISKWFNDMDARYSSIVLEQLVTLEGVVVMETKQERDLPDESFGRWVHVKKNATRGWAQVAVPSERVRDFVLDLCVQMPPEIHGTLLQTKPHYDKQLGHVPETIFVQWQQPKSPPLIVADDLRDVFDQYADSYQWDLAWSHDGSVAEALLQAKVRLADVVVLRLTKLANTPGVVDALLNSELLSECHARMRNANRSIIPDGRGGANFLTPIEPDELRQRGVDIKPYHLVALVDDIGPIQQTLARLPCRQRPHLSDPSVASPFQQAASSLCSHVDSESVAHGDSDDDDYCPVDIVIECSLSTNSSDFWNRSVLIV